MSYSGPTRRKGGTDRPGLMAIGRQLLGDLFRRRQMDPTSPTVSKQVILPDGSIVRAMWYGDQPQVHIIPGPDVVDGEACVLAMESGMLDLGTPTSVTLGLWPIFNDSAPMRHRGTLWDCSVTPVPGDRFGISKQPPASYSVQAPCDVVDVPVASLACSPATVKGTIATTPQKKQAQAVLPASMWTGLMRRYVQALYGSPTAAYRLNEFATEATYRTNKEHEWWTYLLIPSDDEVGYEATWGWETLGTVGIVKIGAGMYFARVERTGVKFRPVRFSACGALAYQAYRASPAGPSRDALLSAALSTAIVGGADTETVSLFATDLTDDKSGDWYFRRAPGRYGWSFNHAGTAASLAVAEYRERAFGDPVPSPFPNAVLFRIDFTADTEGLPVATLVTVESTPADLCIFPDVGHPGTYVPTRDNLGMITFANTVVSSPDSRPLENVDAPVFAYYDTADALVVIRVLVENAMPVGTGSSSTCYNADLFATAFKDGTECETTASDVHSYAAIGFYKPGWTNVRIANWTQQALNTAVCFEDYGTPTTQTNTGTTFTPAPGPPDFAVDLYEIAQEACKLCSDSLASTTLCTPGEGASIRSDRVFTVQPYTRRTVEVENEHMPDMGLILLNGSATAPTAWDYRVTGGRKLFVVDTETNRVVKTEWVVSISGFACDGAVNPSFRCEMNGSSLGALPTPLPADVATTGYRFTSNELMVSTVLYPTPVVLQNESGTQQLFSGADPTGKNCVCGPDIAATASTHDPVYKDVGAVTGTRPLYFNMGNSYINCKAAQSIGGAYSTLAEYGFRWAFPPGSFAALASQPWPLTSSHALPAVAGSYYSFIGWV